ncbi:hypothetical protein [Paenibacillus oryzae]|uniref:hypothetical protein n=1 Tax=Paenibacillus oryzae TaxID=1844972 RepID=UPI0012EA3817|nr:hypothetical protein [Paenibacillus oryzae]
MKKLPAAWMPVANCYFKGQVCTLQTGLLEFSISNGQKGPLQPQKPRIACSIMP